MQGTGASWGARKRRRAASFARLGINTKNQGPENMSCLTNMGAVRGRNAALLKLLSREATIKNYVTRVCGTSQGAPSRSPCYRYLASERT